MLNCSSCTRPPRLAIVADMLETYKTFVAASNNEIRLLPLPYMLPLPPLSWLQPVSSTRGDAYHDILPQESYCWLHHNVQFRGLWRQMTVSTMAGSHYRQWAIGYVALYGHPLYIIQLIDSCLRRYGHTYIQLHVASYSCSFLFFGWFLNVHPGSHVRWLHWQCPGEVTCVGALEVCQGLA
jgi:hypothetical protein